MHDHNSIYDNLEPAQRPDVQLLSSVDLAAIEGARDVMTIHVTLPPASPGTRPHRHSGPHSAMCSKASFYSSSRGKPRAS